MIALLVIGIIVASVGLYFWRRREGDFDNQHRGKVASIIGLIIIISSIIGSSLVTVPAGHRGVVIRFGAVTGTILEEGLQVKLPFIESVVKMSVQTEKYEAGAAAASLDLQDVRTTIALNWRLQPEATAEIYRTLGLGYIDRIAAPAVQETVKQVTAKYNAEDLILRRDEVKAAIEQSLATRLLQRGIITEAVSITEFQFSDTFVAAIEAKVAAEQAVQEARNKLERVKVEAEQREAQALGEAAARIATAEGEAEYIRIVTDAQVAANAAIAESLSPEVLQYIFLDRLGEDIKVIVIPSEQGLDLVIPELTP
ncbi:MAG: prohibitin family protein [Dehalococcoidales bacterium]|nr:prohibitin family protein [Dehalococcoidales bacterium]